MRNLYPICITIILLVCISCGPAATDTSKSEVLNGTPDKNGTFPYVVYVHGKLNSNFNLSQFQCSGVLITKDYVLTGAHCFCDKSGPTNCNFHARVYFESTDGSETLLKTFHGGKASIFPKYKGVLKNASGNGGDLALIRLNRSAPNKFRTFAGRQSHSLAAGDTVTFVGFGHNKCEHNGKFGYRKFGENKIYSISDEVILVGPYEVGKTSSYTIPLLHDSGGPLFYKSGSSYKLAGILSTLVSYTAGDLQDVNIRCSPGKDLGAMYSNLNDKNVRFWIDKTLSEVCKGRGQGAYCDGDIRYECSNGQISKIGKETPPCSLGQFTCASPSFGLGQGGILECAKKSNGCYDYHTIGMCPSNKICTNDKCVSTSCSPQCAGKDCGDDSCGGNCGSCGANVCVHAIGKCVPSPKKCPHGNGLYCGDGQEGRNKDTLYRCENGIYNFEKNCSNGCQDMGDSRPDKCFDCSCQAVSYGDWSTCSGFENSCDETGTKKRTITKETCINKRCIPSKSEETQNCARVTEGNACSGGVCKSGRLMLRFEVLRNEKPNQRGKQGFTALSNVMNELKEAQVEREFFL